MIEMADDETSLCSHPPKSTSTLLTIILIESADRIHGNVSVRATTVPNGASGAVRTQAARAGASMGFGATALTMVVRKLFTMCA